MKSETSEPSNIRTIFKFVLIVCSGHNLLNMAVFYITPKYTVKTKLQNISTDFFHNLKIIISYIGLGTP
jgi:hypothetical protein